MISHISSPHISHVVPLNSAKLDPRWLLERTIENLCIQHIFAEQTTNANQLPNEYSFQCEFASIFKQIFLLAYPTLGYRVLIEVKERGQNGDRRQRLDILVRDHTQPAYGFELVVAASEVEFDEHCRRSQEYRKLHSCYMYMVNLCPKPSLRNYYGNISTCSHVTPVNVIIDQGDGEWKAEILYKKSMFNSTVTIKTSKWDMMFDNSIKNVI